MIVSHDWLRGFVPHSLSPEALGELLSKHVATLDALEATRADLAPFVVARVVESERIPETKLSFNKVDDGSGELLEVVCGAPNVTVGTRYPFARTGTVMPAGLRIEKRKIRGFTSNGMLCSARELGLGEEHDGILPLETEAAPGTPLLDVLPVGDHRLELDVLANRPDLLSQRGVAREVSALTRIPLATPAELRDLPAAPAAARGEREASAGGVSVRLEDADGCPRYMAAVIRGVTVGPSPEWLARRIESVGGRPVNNVVDATNYVLHALGQPTHAFDLAKLAGRTIVVRRGGKGEKLVTLDGVERTVGAEMLVIADAERATAIAGVMGGRASEVTEGTTDVLLEVAVFDRRRVRIGRKLAGISSDASYRFERGVDARALEEALSVTAGLIAKVAGGAIETVLDVGSTPVAARTVELRVARVARVLGVELPAAEIRSLLEGIGFTLEGAGEGAFRVTAPSWRNDVERDVDLIEDIARLRGFDALPDELRPFRPGRVPDHPQYLAANRVRLALVGAGLLEARPLPFVKGDDATHQRVVNPLAEDEPHLRVSILETLARRAEYNLARMQGNVRLFEVGDVFMRAGARLPEESLHVGVLVMGDRRPRHFTEPSPPAFDAWDAKGIAELLAAAAHPGREITLVGDEREDGTLWLIQAGDTRLGRVARVALDAPVWASPAFGVELSLGVVPSAVVASHGANAWEVASERPTVAPHHVTVTALPTTPAAEFDLALLLPEETAASEVERVLRTAGGDLLERLELFDEYRGEKVAPGFRSVAWRLTFRHPERTLRDKEVEGRRAMLLKTLEAELGIRPRTA